MDQRLLQEKVAFMENQLNAARELLLKIHRDDTLERVDTYICGALGEIDELKQKPLQVEVNQKFVEADTNFKVGGATLMLTPPLDEDYWLFRVKLFEDQAILGFPKFGTIGIGFAREDDWNTNLPYTCETQEIYDHISHNKHYDQIPEEQALEAIRLVQEAAKNFKQQAQASA